MRARIRKRVVVEGLVQGVGFRPFVYRLAQELGLCGWAANAPWGMTLELEGCARAIERFLARMQTEAPPYAEIRRLRCEHRPTADDRRFELRSSIVEGDPSAFVLPDIAVCQDCRRELFDRGDRRYRYPFISCTHCGPRFSIVEALPYDRSRTSMRRFRLCGACQSEYEDPSNRRYHAQTNACSACGPSIRLWDRDGMTIAQHDAAVQKAAALIKEGAIIALKGIGGFQLIVTAGNEDAVARLREAKQRPDKPFAVMCRNLAAVEKVCAVSRLERRLLCSPAAPIVLLRNRGTHGELAANIAPANPWLGVMLPYSPLHHLLLADVDGAVVATSGNRGDEPICIDEDDARLRLSGIADYFLVHDRPIERALDDSVVREAAGQPMILRRARGYAPLPVTIAAPGADVLAVGGHLKNTIAVTKGDQVIVSAHIGQLDNLESRHGFQTAVNDLQRLYRVRPSRVAHDLHPDYFSTRFAASSALPVIPVQHHYAHVLACMAEHDLQLPLLGIAWDGSGLGTDGSLWGGECILIEPASVDRVASLRSFALPGGEQAVREPRRAALGLLYELFGQAVFEQQHLVPLLAFTERERTVLKTMLDNRLNAPRCSSVGRLFDATASLLGLAQRTSFEGQAAIKLESALERTDAECSYSIRIDDYPSGMACLDWGPMIRAMLKDLENAHSISVLALKFHNALAQSITDVAGRAKVKTVVLTGGCLQNRFLLERAVHRLRREGYRPYWPTQFPPNDGGIALGQAMAAHRKTLQNKVDQHK